MAKKQKAESELTEITIHGVDFRYRLRARGTPPGTYDVALLALDRSGEDSIGVVLSLSHNDPDLGDLLADGGKYSVTIRREEGCWRGERSTCRRTWSRTAPSPAPTRC